MIGIILCGLTLSMCASKKTTDIIGFYSPSGVQGIYNDLGAKRKTIFLDKSAARSVIDLGSIRTDYKSARVDKYINDYTGYPDHHHISQRDWTGVYEGFVKLDYQGLNGDGWYLWIFITIQSGEHYVIYANNDHADNFPIGVSDCFGQEGQVWFYRWE